MNKPVYDREVFRRMRIPNFVVKPDEGEGANLIADRALKAFDLAMLDQLQKGIHAMPVAEPGPARVTEQEAYHRLQTADYGTLLGEGSGGGFFSKVYRGQVPGTVVKVCTTKADKGSWDAWLLWAAYCMTRTRRSMYLPDILAVHVDLNKGEYRAIIEELKPQNGIKVKERLNLQCPVRKAHTRKVTGTDAWQVQDTVKDMLNFLGSVGVDGDFYIDAHQENWMCRQEVVGAVFGAIRAAEEHEMKEWFTYKGARIFNPHLDPDVLAEVARSKSSFNFRENAMSMEEG